MPKDVDFLIVGHGLAGALLAYQLVQQGKSVLVYDNQAKQTASRVAAGIINPVTGHRLNITEGFSTFYPAATRIYKQLESAFKADFFKPTPQLRMLKNQGQHDYFIKRSNDPAYQAVLGAYRESPWQFPNSQYGAVEIQQSAVVDTNTLLLASCAWLKARDAYQAGEFDYQQLGWQQASIDYQGVRAQRLIFCEGVAALKNPWLKDLPFKPAKGEIVDLELDTATEFLNWGNWLIPGLTKNTARLGSTYEWNDLSRQSKQSEKLTDSLKQHTGITALKTSSTSGVRPTTIHRTPFIGRISRLSNAYCFNGFGSKGCLLIPYYAELLSEHILNDTSIPKELYQWL